MLLQIQTLPSYSLDVYIINVTDANIAVLTVYQDPAYFLNQFNSMGNPCISGINKQNGSYMGGLMQERHNSSALAMELRLSCTNLSILH